MTMEADGLFRSTQFESEDMKPVLSLLNFENLLAKTTHSAYLTVLLRDSESLIYLRNLIRVPTFTRHGVRCLQSGALTLHAEASC